MRINNNITAINAHRNYTINSSGIGKSVEKLSSGYRINRAGDDAAGLAISEKMRVQIRGLTMASKNSQDAVSLIQTAEGALQSTHNVLQRMRELAVQSASDTNEQTIDRAALEQEFSQLKAEIDDTAVRTRFNDQNLIDGTFQKFTNYRDSKTTLELSSKYNLSLERASVGEYNITLKTTAEKQTTVVSGTSVQMSAYLPGVTGSAINGNGSPIGPGTTGSAAGMFEKITLSGLNTGAHNGNVYTLKVTGSDLENMTFQLTDTQGKTVATSQVNILKDWKTASDDASADDPVGAKGKVVFEGIGTFEFTGQTSNSATGIDNTLTSYTQLGSLNGVQIAMRSGVSDKVTEAVVADVEVTINGITQKVRKGDDLIDFKELGLTFKLKDAITDKDLLQTANFFSATGISSGQKVTVARTVNDGLTIQTGANQGDELRINIDAMNSGMLGIAFSDIRTQDNASLAITQVNDALNQVSTQRAALGALQNRLEYKMANLDTSAENLQAAESRIRDVDMAKEMTDFTKKNILFQASTAMLAQANSLPQGVLQLLG
jgi:flagellin